MCKFNVIFVNNSNNEKILEHNEYYRQSWNFKHYFPYIKGVCNCGSFVGSMADFPYNNYSQMLEELNSEELQKLNKIKEFMNRPSYKKEREKYIAQRDILSSDVEKFFETMSNYEMEQINLLEAKYNGKKLEKQINLLYKDIEEKSLEILNSPEYIAAEEKLNKFVEKNQLMDESTLYYLTKEDEQKDKESQEMLDDDLFEDIDVLTDTIEYIDIPEESLVIDTVIENLKSRYQADYNDFLEYIYLFETLLENEEYILFCCIWNKPEKLSIEKEVNIKDVKIEDLSSLKYNKILKIVK